MNFQQLLDKKIIVCDGAMGTMMQKSGLKLGEIPELLSFTQPDVIEGIHRQYYEAGSDFVSANTFGSNAFKLAQCPYSVKEVITRAMDIAKKAASYYEDKFVALDIGPYGKLMEPTGDLTFETAYESYKEQVIAGEEAGADLILFETFTDIYEMKIAVLAAKENTKLPIICSMTFQQDARTLMGTDPLTAVNILQDMGIDCVGLNCSMGPKQLIPIVEKILTYATIPVIVQPNAGLPRLENGQTVYDIDHLEYAQITASFVQQGVRVIGGCCGTTPLYIKELVKNIQDEHPKANSVKPFTAASSATKTVILDGRVRIIGERINPTGKKKLKEALKGNNLEYIAKEGAEQVACGAEILDINVGMPEIDEKQMMICAMKKVAEATDAPLQIDSANPLVIEAAARFYNGKPIINSVNGKQSVMEAIFPIVKKYGACVIALALDDQGLPETAAQRVEIIGRIIDKAKEYGIGKERIIADCLTLTVSAQPSGALQTLEAIKQVKAIYGISTTLGASNISFGLPQRKLLNQTFLAAALTYGLDAPITDPLIPEYVQTIRSFEVLNCKDIEAKDYIAYCVNLGESESALPNKTKDKKEEQEPTLTQIIIDGYQEKAAQATQELLKTMEPNKVVSEVIVPALERVGVQYETGEAFLPQLIKSAETVQSAFQILKKEMEKSGEKISRGKIVLATVKGDIHDIGKNIAKIILENNGYDMIDLGKDVDIDCIVETVQREDIKLLGLSALMTTTVVSMEETIKAVKAVKPDCKIMVGGAVLTEEFAKAIGADFYCKDALAGVRAANCVL